MNSLVLYFRTIIIFIIFISFISILIPDKKYKNYLDFVLGLILISIVISPISNLFNSNKNIINAEIFTENTQESIYTNNTNYTANLYEAQLSNQIALTIENNFDFTTKNINTKVNTENLSIIEEITLTLVNNSIYIEPINITSQQNIDNVEKEDIKTIKNFLSKEYNLSLSNIHINIDN